MLQQRKSKCNFFYGICNQWLKHPQVVLSLWAGAVIGSWCNFLTVMYIGERPAFFSSVDRSIIIECVVQNVYFK